MYLIHVQYRMDIISNVVDKHVTVVAIRGMPECNEGTVDHSTFTQLSVISLEKKTICVTDSATGQLKIITNLIPMVEFLNNLGQLCSFWYSFKT